MLDCISRVDDVADPVFFRTQHLDERVLGTKRSFPPGYEPTLAVFLAPDWDKRARFIECGSEEHVDDVQRVAEEELRLIHPVG